LRLSAGVSAELAERENTDYWRVVITWTASCQGVSEGKSPVYNGDLYMVDVDTDERHYVGGVVDASGSGSVTDKREWFVSAIPRAQYLRPELTIGCYEQFPQHGGPTRTVTGDAVVIPPAFDGRGDDGAGGGDQGYEDYGRGDPTEPAGARGCRNALAGTNGPDTLDGDEGGDVIFGFDARDLIRGRGGNDCLIGGKGNDRLDGHGGGDRLTGGRGRDVLVGSRGHNAYDAGPGKDYVNARNGRRELIRCGGGRDRARTDRRDRVRGCEHVSRPG
jgi:Ca2+-binding RTX toxin-like protein